MAGSLQKVCALGKGCHGRATVIQIHLDGARLLGGDAGSLPGVVSSRIH